MEVEEIGADVTETVQEVEGDRVNRGMFLRKDH